jgi:hypothetical protein
MVLSIPPLIATNTFPFLLIKNEACLPAGGLQIYVEYAPLQVSKTDNYGLYETGS